MATPAQIAANRRNARKSTGPQTARGKAISSRSALKHGVCSPGLPPDEDPAEFEAFVDHIRRDPLLPLRAKINKFASTLTRSGSSAAPIALCSPGKIQPDAPCALP